VVTLPTVTLVSEVGFVVELGPELESPPPPVLASVKASPSPTCSSSYAVAHAMAAASETRATELREREARIGNWRGAVQKVARTKEWQRG
jgi:hypothetical protein